MTEKRGRQMQRKNKQHSIVWSRSSHCTYCKWTAYSKSSCISLPLNEIRTLQTVVLLDDKGQMYQDKYKRKWAVVCISPL